MTPEQIQIQELREDVNTLKQVIASLNGVNLLSPEMKKTLTELNVSSSTKGSTTERVTVVESGSDVHTVLDEPDGFDKATIGGAVHYYPYYL